MNFLRKLEYIFLARSEKNRTLLEDKMREEARCLSMEAINENNGKIFKVVY